MAEMNAVSRWFVNAVKGRANARLYAWLEGHLALPAAARCLEVGCGNGNMAARIVDGFRPARYWATDLDARQVAAAREYLTARYPRGVPAPLEVREADMLGLPFDDASVDAVFAFSAIHHASPSHRDFSEVPRALAEIDRVLRPGGLLAYEEFIHKDRVRGWLADHGYAIEALGRRWTRENVIARKGTASTGRENPTS